MASRVTRPATHPNRPRGRAPNPRPRVFAGLPVVLGAAAGLAVCILVLALLLLLNGRTTNPRTTAQALCADLQSQDYQSMYDVLSPRMQVLGTQAQFAASQQQLDALRGPVTGCLYDVQSADSTQANVTLTVTRARAPQTQAVVHFLYIGDAWKVDTYDASVI
jgi:hypothetical protein